MSEGLDPDGEFEDDVKQLCWEWAWLGYVWGYGVEEMDPVDYRAARSKFNQQWKRRMENG